MSDLLLDENVDKMLGEQLELREGSLHVYAIGDGLAPPKGTPDPAILVWMQVHDCMLLTYNRSSMPVHLEDHLAAGRHIPGIIQLASRMGVGEMIEHILLIWGASLPNEYQDRIVYLPLRD